MRFRVFPFLALHCVEYHRRALDVRPPAFSCQLMCTKSQQLLIESTSISYNVFECTVLYYYNKATSKQEPQKQSWYPNDSVSSAIVCKAQEWARWGWRTVTKRGMGVFASPLPPSATRQNCTSISFLQMTQASATVSSCSIIWYSQEDLFVRSVGLL